VEVHGRQLAASNARALAPAAMLVPARLGCVSPLPASVTTHVLTAPMRNATTGSSAIALVEPTKRVGVEELQPLVTERWTFSSGALCIELLPLRVGRDG